MDEILYKVVKIRYAAGRDYSKSGAPFIGYYVYSQKTDYRHRKSDATSALNHAEKSNKQADAARRKRPDFYPDYYRVEVSTVRISELEKFAKVMPPEDVTE